MIWALDVNVKQVNLKEKMWAAKVVCITRKYTGLVEKNVGDVLVNEKESSIAPTRIRKSNI